MTDESPDYVVRHDRSKVGQGSTVVGHIHEPMPAAVKQHLGESIAQQLLTVIAERDGLAAELAEACKPVGEPLAYLHMLHMEGEQRMRRLSFEDDPEIVWGEPGKDYSEEYPVSVMPLVSARKPVGDDVREHRRDKGKEAERLANIIDEWAHSFNPTTQSARDFMKVAALVRSYAGLRAERDRLAADLAAERRGREEAEAANRSFIDQMERYDAKLKAAEARADALAQQVEQAKAALEGLVSVCEIEGVTLEGEHDIRRARAALSSLSHTE